MTSDYGVHSCRAIISS